MALTYTSFNWFGYFKKVFPSNLIGRVISAASVPKSLEHFNHNVWGNELILIYLSNGYPRVFYYVFRSVFRGNPFGIYRRSWPGVVDTRHHFGKAMTNLCYWQDEPKCGTTTDAWRAYDRKVGLYKRPHFAARPHSPSVSQKLRH